MRKQEVLEVIYIMRMKYAGYERRIAFKIFGEKNCREGYI
jgi:hypothetical protein